MKIKGIHRKPNRKTGKRAGDVIEYSPEEKIPLAVKEAVINQAPEGCQWLPCDIAVDKFNFIPLKNKAIEDKRFTSNAYSANGKVYIKTLVHKSDKLFPKKEHSFSIKFEDALDYLGQPDLEVTEFNLK